MGPGDPSDIEQRLTARGSPFALDNVDCCGRTYRVYSHAPRNILALIRKPLYSSDATALVADDVALSYRAMLHSAAELAGAMRRQYAAGAGTRVGIALGNRSETVIAFIAIAMLGGTAVLIGNASQDRVRHCTKIADCELLLGEDGDGPEKERADPWIADLRRGDLSLAERNPLKTNLANVTGGEHAPSNAPHDSDAIISFTSGTTGTPKGVMLTHRGVITGLMNMMLASSMATTSRQQSLRSQSRSCSLVLSPFSHVSGYTQLLLQLMLGGKVVLGGDWPVERIAQAVEKEQVKSIVGLAPSTMLALLDHAGTRELSSLTTFHISGFALHRNIAKTLTDRLPHISLGTSYGMTETNGAICALAGGDLLERPYSSGRVVPTADVKIVGEDGGELPPGETGEIWLRGAMLFRGYCAGRGGPDASGWYQTGDSGSLTDDRHLSVADRLQDIVTVRSKTISCLAIERTVMEFPGIDEVAAIGVKTAGETDMAVAVVATAHPDPEIVTALRTKLREAVGREAKLVLLSELPRTSSGKINQNALRRLFERPPGIA
jgi:long-chain acyl-CoA synthetase